MAVREQTVGADAGATVQAKDVLLVLLSALMNHTRVKELLPQKNFKPVRNITTKTNLQTPRNPQRLTSWENSKLGTKEENIHHFLFFYSCEMEVGGGQEWL